MVMGSARDPLGGRRVAGTQESPDILLYTYTLVAAGRSQNGLGSGDW